MVKLVTTVDLFNFNRLVSHGRSWLRLYGIDDHLTAHAERYHADVIILIRSFNVDCDEKGILHLLVTAILDYFF